MSQVHVDILEKAYEFIESFEYHYLCNAVDFSGGVLDSIDAANQIINWIDTALGYDNNDRKINTLGHWLRTYHPDSEHLERTIRFQWIRYMQANHEMFDYY